MDLNLFYKKGDKKMRQQLDELDSAFKFKWTVSTGRDTYGYNLYKQEIKENLAKLGGKEWKIAAWRCGVLTLPFLGNKGNFNFWGEKIKQENLYAIFYALDIALAAATTTADKAIAADRAWSTSLPRKIFTHHYSNGIALLAIFNAYFAAKHDTYNAATSYYIRYCPLKIEPIIRAMYQNKTEKHMVSVEWYGEYWDNFQTALKNEGCAYWGKVYKRIFENELRVDQQSLEHRLNVPKKVQMLGAKAVAEYLERK